MRVKGKRIGRSVSWKEEEEDRKGPFGYTID